MSIWLRLLGDYLLAPFQYSDRRLPKRVEAVWVLSGPELSVSGSNGQRIGKGLQLGKKHRASYFIFNGVPDQNRQLKRFLAKRKTWPFRLIIFNCAVGLKGNTRQQVQSFAARKKLARLQSIVVVSSLVHLPRVKRYLVRFTALAGKIYFVGVGLLFDRQLTIVSELKKLIRYNQKGDLDL